MTRVYLVEDSPILTKLLTGLIDAEPGVSVVGHADAASDAISEVAQLRPDVLVLDLHLREGTGIDVLRALPKHGVAPVAIVLTNHAAPQYRQAALAAGAQHFFDKSTEIPLMLTLIRTLPRRAQAPG